MKSHVWLENKRGDKKFRYCGTSIFNIHRRVMNFHFLYSILISLVPFCCSRLFFYNKLPPGVNMFNLTKLEHTLRLKPHLLSLSLEEAVKGELESLFVDKVIANLGLCISVYDLESIDGGFFFANEGAPTYTVKFRLIIFRPYVGEIVSAKLKESNCTGLRLTLGFFDDIYIPELLMPEPSRFKLDADHKNQGIWTWDFNDEEYFIDGQDEIRFRVQNVKFPEIPNQQIGTKPFAPMEITGSLVSDGGLGPVSWWV